jgi:Bax protein
MKESSELIQAWAVVVILLLSGCDNNKIYGIKTEKIRIHSLDQILLIQDSLVKPILYSNIHGLDKLSVEKAKSKFIDAILPSILIAKHQVEQHRKKVLILQKKSCWNAEDSSFYDDARIRYNAKDLEDLGSRIGTLPTSIVLAQAAVESGWGQSRFFLKASNLFGVWSFNAHEPRIMARKSRKNQSIYLKSYTDLSQSITDYFGILGRAGAYKNLRKTRLKTQNPFLLLPHLKNFSERKTLYTRQLRAVIILNNLTRYDHYEIDPEYLIEEQ